MTVTLCRGAYALGPFDYEYKKFSRAKSHDTRLTVHKPQNSTNIPLSLVSAYEAELPLLYKMEAEQLADYGSESSIPEDVDSLTHLFNSALRFLEPSFGVTDGVMAQISSMYRTAPSQSTVRSAVNTLAMERLGLDNEDSGLLAQAQSEYGRTLLKVREALGDSVESRRDETLVSIQLLCHFEVCYRPYLVIMIRD